MGALILKSSSGKHYLKDKMMLGLFCISALIAVTAGQAPVPLPSPPGQVLPPPPPSPYGPPRPGYPMPMRHYGRPPMGPFGKRPGGGIDPLTLMMLQGGLGGSGDNDDLLPLLLLGGGGLGGHPGKGGLGGGMDPLQFLAFQKGGLGGSGGNDNLLPLLLLGGGGHPGKGGLGGMNPLLLSGLLGCKEPVEDCTIPNKADGTLCGVNGQNGEKVCCECKKA